MVRVYALITLGGKGLCTYNSRWWVYVLSGGFMYSVVRVYVLITLGGKGLCTYNSRW